MIVFMVTLDNIQHNKTRNACLFVLIVYQKLNSVYIMFKDAVLLRLINNTIFITILRTENVIMKIYNFKKKATLCLLCFTMLFIFIPSIVCAATNEQNTTHSDVEVQYCKTTDPGEICDYMYGKYKCLASHIFNFI